MSGGELNYAYDKIHNIADDIEHKKNDLYFEDETSLNVRMNIRAEINSILEELDNLSPRLKHLEWWLSGDYGDDTYSKLLEKT